MYNVRLINGDTVTVIHSQVGSQKIYGGTVREIKNQPSSFTFRIPVTNDGFELIENYASEIRVKNMVTSRELFRGFVVQNQTVLSPDGVYKSVTCTSELDLLSNAVVAPFSTTYYQNPDAIMESVLDIYDQQASSDRQIYVGNVGMTRLNADVDDYCTAKEALEQLFVNARGWEIKLRYGSDGKRYIDANESLGNTAAGTVVTIGKNLQTLQINKEIYDLCTRFYPYGGDDINGSRVKISAANQGVEYIENTALINTYGIISKVKFYDNIKQRENGEQGYIAASQKLYNAASIDFKTNYNKERVSVSLTALDLSLKNADYDSFELYDRYPVKAVIDGKTIIDDILEVSEKTTLLDSPQRSSLVFGDRIKTLTARLIRR